MTEHTFLETILVHAPISRTYATETDRDNDTPSDDPIAPETVVPVFQVTENIYKEVVVVSPVTTFYRLVGVDPTVWTTLTTLELLALSGVLAIGNTTGGSDIVVDAGDKVTLTDDPVLDTDAANKGWVNDQLTPIPPTRVTGNTTLGADDRDVFADTDGGGFTVTLPAGISGTYYRILNSGSSNNNLTLEPDGAELLLGENSGFTLTDGDVLIIVYDSTEGWY